MGKTVLVPILFGISLFVSGCGTVVPGLQELTDDPGAEQKLVQAIITSIHCDISNAVRDLIDDDIASAKENNGRRFVPWIDNWGAQVAITLAVEDKGTLRPSVLGMPPSPANAIFSISGSATGSATATRTSKANFFYTVKDLYRRSRCTQGLQPPVGAPSPLIQSDLKIGDWLFDQITPSASREVNYPTSSANIFKQNVLSHEVKFLVSTSGSLGPAWKLTRVSTGGAGPLLEASRDRTSDLLVTFGPLDPKQNNTALAPIAESIHVSQQFGLAVSTSLPRPSDRLLPLF